MSLQYTPFSIKTYLKNAFFNLNSHPYECFYIVFIFEIYLTNNRKIPSKQQKNKRKMSHSDSSKYVLLVISIGIKNKKRLCFLNTRRRFKVCWKFSRTCCDLFIENGKKNKKKIRHFMLSDSSVYALLVIFVVNKNKQ
jgi:hypothetical protein